MRNLYYNLSRCLVVVVQHPGSTLETLYNLAHKRRIPETTRYRIKNYFDKMISDGMIYEKEEGRYYPTQEEGSE